MSGKNKRGLGKGLDALIPVTSEENNTGAAVAEIPEGELVRTVKMTMVEPNRNQPRKTFDEDALEELADSIRQKGVINPLIVQDRKDHYEIIAGERRWRAARKAGLKEIPVIIRNLTEEEIAEIALIDNLQREDINEVEEALAYKRLIDEFGYTQDVVAEKVSKSRVSVTNKLRLLKLSEDVRQMIIDNKITGGHARTLIAVEDEAEQLRLAEQIFDEKLSVRQAEQLLKSLGKTAKAKREKKKNESVEAAYRELEEKCKQATGTRVVITGKGDGTGKLEIEFYSTDDLEKITDRLMGR